MPVSAGPNNDEARRHHVDISGLIACWGSALFGRLVLLQAAAVCGVAWLVVLALRIGTIVGACSQMRLSESSMSRSFKTVMGIRRSLAAKIQALDQIPPQSR